MSSSVRWSVWCDTGDSFNGRNIIKTWKLEEQKLNNIKNPSSYSYPELDQSKYLKSLRHNALKPNICQDIFWSCDGTSFITVNDDWGIRQYLVPSKEVAKPEDMVAFTRSFKQSSIICSAVHPNYSLYNNDLTTNLMLMSSRALPLQAYTINFEGMSNTAVLVYDIKNKKSDEFETPYSISFINDQQFVIGSKKNRVSLFHVNRSEPISCMSPQKLKNNREQGNGIVSCFSEFQQQFNFPNSQLYFGTYSGNIGIIDKRHQKYASFNATESRKSITQLLLTANEQYLYAVKRNSNTIDVLDTRFNLKKVNQLALPNSTTNQKFKASLTRNDKLLFGTNHGSIIQWSDDFISFGGIPTTSKEKLTDDSHYHEYSYKGPETSINVIKGSPIDFDTFAVSHSPDKKRESDETLKNESGISIMLKS